VATWGAPRDAPVFQGVFLYFAVTERLYALFHLVAFRGLRRGEVAGLPWTDVDLEGGTTGSARPDRTATSIRTIPSPSTATAP
jgi:integrase